MNNMFYLIRINRRDKPHSRIGNDSAAKNNSCPGNERANFNYRENQGRKRCLAPPRRRTGQASAAPRTKIKATKWPFRNSRPSPLLAADTPAGGVGGQVSAGHSWRAGDRARGIRLPGPPGRLSLQRHGGHEDTREEECSNPKWSPGHPATCKRPSCPAPSPPSPARYRSHVLPQL